MTTQPRPASPARFGADRLDVITARHIRIWLVIVVAVAAIGAIGFVVLERGSGSDAQ